MEVKVPWYDILNMLLTGLVFWGGFAIMYAKEVLEILVNPITSRINSGPEIVVTVCCFAVAYETGFLINRIGSTFFEPAMKAMHIVFYNEDYAKFNQKKKIYPIMSTLSREYALSRTSIVLFFILMLCALATCHWLIAAVCVFIVVTFGLSCRKHSKKIVDLMAEPENKEKNVDKPE